MIDLRGEWSCPNCIVKAFLPPPKPGQTHLHTCPGLHGLTAPLLPPGVRAKVEIREREDYVGQETVRLHEGRPVMSVVTTRDDGQDVIVFAPTASITGAAHMKEN